MLIIVRRHNYLVNHIENVKWGAKKHLVLLYFSKIGLDLHYTLYISRMIINYIVFIPMYKVVSNQNLTQLVLHSVTWIIRST